MFYFFLALLVASAQAKFYSDCGSRLATIQNVGVSGCSMDAKSCILKRNTNVTINIDFTPSKAVTSVETVVHGIIMNLPVPFPISQPDACKGNGLTCPLKAGEKQAYKTTLAVLKAYPKVSVDVKWELKTEAGEELVCILIPAQIK
ncbi:ecdysteroid-regulated 16 kDa protein-like [Pieris brassicae]|uniref:MD-2-related lipid-recognition domain-containing protein n=1 Tax=Pieris brassicae TaxID=7116 RepID=A0A9P0TMW0_PIEBR|nr:ecdysteroid-regulated 16 kDa protein-like [Pieris brassicae]CAH4031672.1 unnamed protein product [Pieris brassicae]